MCIFVRMHARVHACLSMFVQSYTCVDVDKNLVKQ